MIFIRKELIVTGLLMFGFSAVGQVERNTGQITGGIYGGANIQELRSATESYPNDNYLYEEWYYGSINLKGSDKYDVREIPIKVNIVRNTIEFRHERVVKEINMAAINSFRLLIPNKLDAEEFVSVSGDDAPETYKINYQGEKYTSMIKYTYDVIPADYNAQFDTGSKVDRVKINETVYIKDESTGVKEEVKLSKRGLRSYFEARDKTAYDYIKKKKPSLEDEADLFELMKSLNQ